MLFARRSPLNITPLAHSTLVVIITDLVAEYELHHAFHNDGFESIEAVYSFPVPLDSAFMGMEATLAGERRVAKVLPRTQATQDYDDAITEGDSAVLLERLEPGMLCVSLGNLKPGESGEVVLRFAAPLHCAGGAARFSLPLVHRPRYGRSRLDEVVEPRHDFAVEHPLDATIRIRGLLAHAPVSCATHAARFAADAAGQELRLKQAMLDRDLVLIFELPEGFAGQARLIRDGEAAIGMLSFNVPQGTRQVGPCDLCLVLDGSGSMTGDAIAQSRAALSTVASLLSDEDRIYVLRFGSTTVPLFRRPLKATMRVREAMNELADTVDSNLGGTEIRMALQNAIGALAGLKASPNRSQAIIVATDGAVQPHEIQAAQEIALGLGIRIFVVAVGSSAGADVLAPLATTTGGVLERAVPAEPIDEVVARQLHRAREPAPVAIEIDWNCPQATSLPIGPVYTGDTVTAIAMLPVGQCITAEVRIGHGDATRVSVPGKPEEAPALCAIAGQLAWQHAPDEAKETLALCYGLVTEETSAVLVKVRTDNDKVEGQPVVMRVAHMLPEGMVVAASMTCMAVGMSSNDGFEYLDIPAFLRKDSDDQVRIAEKRAKRTSKGHGASIVAKPLTLDPVILTTLTGALAHLLLDDGTEDVTLQKLLSLVDEAWRDQVAAYLAIECPRGINWRSALALLSKLLARSTIDYTLTDDQEAMFAVLGRRSA